MSETEPAMNRYTEYFEVNAAGQIIGLMTCLDCGAAIIASRDKPNATELHDEFHRRLLATGVRL